MTRNKSNDYRRFRTSMYAWCQHQRPEGKRGAHKLKRLAWREEITTLIEENLLDKPMINLKEVFEKYADESLTFPQLVNPLHPTRPDIAAFLLLDKLVPNDGYNIIEGAGHDVVWLNTNVELLAEVATEEDILYLIRCGVHLNNDIDCLEMFT